MQTAQLVSGDLFGLTDAQVEKIVYELTHSDWGRRTPTSGEIAAALSALSTEEDQDKLVAGLLAAGVPAGTVAKGKSLATGKRAGANGEPPPWWMDREKRKVGLTIWGVIGTVSMAASAYHGYARNGSIGWGLWWGLMGSLFPVITPTFAVAQCKREQGRFTLGCRK